MFAVKQTGSKDDAKAACCYCCTWLLEEGDKTWRMPDHISILEEAQAALRALDNADSYLVILSDAVLSVERGKRLQNPIILQIVSQIDKLTSSG